MVSWCASSCGSVSWPITGTTLLPRPLVILVLLAIVLIAVRLRLAILKVLLGPSVIVLIAVQLPLVIPSALLRPSVIVIVLSRPPPPLGIMMVFRTITGTSLPLQRSVIVRTSGNVIATVDTRNFASTWTGAASTHAFFTSSGGAWESEMITRIIIADADIQDFSL